MKKIKITWVLFTVALGGLVSSCESYLDRAPESVITEKDAFGNFHSFQGFIEELYNCVVDLDKAGAWNPNLFADETLLATPFPFDQGNYWAQTDLHYGTTANTDNDTRAKRIWPLAWYGIRKANVALNRLEYLEAGGTQEERDVIEGQALFYRGFFHFELARWWGGMPYIDIELAPNDDLFLPRELFRETAIKAAADFGLAATKLPIDWDDTEVGKLTRGANRLRVNKIRALSFQAKALLFAASPMMTEESTGVAKYDAELCKQAADVFAEVIELCNSSGMYKLQSWETWTDNFWVWSPGNNTASGGTEVIMNAPVYQHGRSAVSTVLKRAPGDLTGSPNIEVPTASFVRNYGMKDGLPIGDSPLYDPDDPWTDREPRFYSDIMIDGDKVVESPASAEHQYIQLYTGGLHRGSARGSVSGYFYKRYSPVGCNKWDNKQANFQSYIPYMRLADVYMMYAEATMYGYGLNASSPKSGGGLTPIQAIEVVRSRAQLPPLPASYSATMEDLMEVLIRERAIEFAFEGHRFHDLRRWNLNTELKYREKTILEFDRGDDGKPVNIREVLSVTRVAEKKHNWLPLQTAFTKIYDGFYQNPGW